MSKIDMVEQAMEVLGEVSNQAIADFVQTTYGQVIELRFVPCFVASVRDRWHLEKLRSERPAATGPEEVAR